MDPVRQARDLGRRYLDGLATPAERSELERVLRASPAAADAFAQLSRLEADLSALFSEEPGRRREAEMLEAIERDQRRRRWRGRGIRLALAAGVLLFLGGPLLWHLQKRIEPVPPSETANNTVLEGQVLVAGRAVEHLMNGSPLFVAGPQSALLQLSDGSRARLRPGSRAVLYGRSPGLAQRVELIEGEGRFTVRHTEEAFRVDTSVGWVTALGTEFTVELKKPDRGDPRMMMQRMLLAVVVFAGAVQVETEDGRVLLGVGESRVFGQERRPEPGARQAGRRQAMVRAIVAGVKDGKLIITVRSREGSQEETLDVAATAKIMVDDKPAKLADLTKGTTIVYMKDDQGAVTAVRAIGATVGGVVKSTADGKVTLAGRGREPTEDRTYAVAADAKVMIDRQPAKLADLQEGMLVALQLSVDGKTVREITRVPPRGTEGRGRGARGVIKDVDAKAGTITFPGRGEDQTITVPKEAKVIIDGKPGKLENLAKGSTVVIEKDEKGAVISIRVEAVRARGILKSVADGKITLAPGGRDVNEGPTYSVAKDVKVTIDGKPGKLADIKEGAPLLLRLSMDGKTVVEIMTVLRRGEGRRERPAPAPEAGEKRKERPAAPAPEAGEKRKERSASPASTVEGQIKAVDAKSSTITLPGLRDSDDDRTFTLASEVKVIIDGKEAKLAKVKVGRKASLKLDRDGKTVLEITVEGDKKQ